MNTYHFNGHCTGQTLPEIQRQLSNDHNKSLSPFSPHFDSQQYNQSTQKAIEKVRDCFGVKGGLIQTTGSGAEAINQILHHVYSSKARFEGKNHFLTLSTEQAPILLSLDKYDALGCQTTLIDPDKNGLISIDALDQHRSSRTALLSISHANPHTGVIQPLDKISQWCQSNDVALHVDISNTWGRFNISFSDIPVDYITVNGEFIHGPKGSGLLWANPEQDIEPIISLGPDWLSAWGADIARSKALCDTIVLMHEKTMHYTTTVSALRHQFESKIIDQTNAIHIFKNTSRIPQTSLLTFPHLSAEYLLYKLSQRGLFATFGGGYTQQLHYILSACGHPNEYAHTSLSFTLPMDVTETDINAAADIVIDEVKRAERYSNHLQEVANEC